jgi:hypothetical protein
MPRQNMVNQQNMINQQNITRQNMINQSNIPRHNLGNQPNMINHQNIPRQNMVNQQNIPRQNMTNQLMKNEKYEMFQGMNSIDDNFNTSENIKPSNGTFTRSQYMSKSENNDLDVRFDELMKSRKYEAAPQRPKTPDFTLDGSGEKVKQERDKYKVTHNNHPNGNMNNRSNGNQSNGIRPNRDMNKNEQGIIEMDPMAFDDDTNQNLDSLNFIIHS